MLRWIKRLLLSRKNREAIVSESLNIVESIANAKALHKELIRIAHPDKNPNNIEIAKELSELININRYNYKELLILKKRIEREL